jgi:predicted aminopeptidase
LSPLFLTLVTLPLLACSPTYVVRGAWEEAGILYRRRPIAELVSDPTTNGETKRKLQLVTDARTFAESLGLDAGGGYQQYSPVDRNDLVWVVSASPKLRLEPYTWWFPIVGRVPYKGFFEKSHAVRAAKRLQERGFDTFVRSSGAFSTLGWFEDPVLSTVLGLDDTALVDTVIHEILHSTVWISNNVSFNETLAEFVGSRGAYEFYKTRDPSLAEKVLQERGDQLRFAAFLTAVSEELRLLYGRQEPKAALLEARERVFVEAKQRWEVIRQENQSKRWREAKFELNNAFIIAQQTYLDRPEIFEDLFQASGGALPLFVEELKRLRIRAQTEGGDPFELVLRRTSELRQSRERREGRVGEERSAPSQDEAR